MSAVRPPDPVEEIAIIGMAGRFPGARNLDEFWRNLHGGVESISFFSEEDALRSGIDPALVRRPEYVRARGILEDADRFDASFFGFTPREAEVMDPQHRVFLEAAWEVLEHGGYDPEQYAGAIGVFAGASMNSYVIRSLRSHPELLATVGGYQVMLGNDKDFLTTRVSYKLNLKGPSIAVQTACSTSLVAVQVACESLWSRRCDMAIAGGVSVSFPQQAGYLYQPGMILSPDGHCRAFDARARGTLGGQGVGLVLLKRLAEAIADGDSVHAVIKGAAINNDGSLKVGYTAPSVDGQAQVIGQALAMGRVEADTISYVEAHGTGTELGDPIEVAALTQAFRLQTARTGFCAVGSVKTNIGHLDAAAGIAGLLKAVLALKHKQLPPSLHFEHPNPQIDFANSPFYVNAALAAWPAGPGPRRAGVSSFGIGGTNAHVVLEEAPPPGPSRPSRPAQLLTLSARSEDALAALTTRLAEHLTGHPETDLADLAFTLHCGRRAFPHRCALVEDSTAAAAALLHDRDPQRVATSVVRSGGRPVAFLFPGQGSQYAGMGRGLYEAEPVFREQVDACGHAMRSTLGFDLREVIFPAGDLGAAAERLRQTSVAQPALFTIEYALARLWMAWGLVPEAMLGHSIGEYVAACLAGVFSLEEALALVVERGRLMQVPGGSMLAVPLPAAEVAELLDGNLSLAAINAPGLSVVSGPTAAVEALRQRLTARGMPCQPLHTAHAFHSGMMDPVLADFTKAVKGVDLRPPAIPFVSNLTGTWITPAEATEPTYWARHLRETVRFADGVGALLSEGDRVLLEVGPGHTLASHVRQHPAWGGTRVVVSSLRHPRDPQPDEPFLLGALGKLWLAGVTIDWNGFHAWERRRRVPLPAYPFERQRYLLEPLPAERASAAGGWPGRRADVSEWFSVPSWRRSVPARAPSPEEGTARQGGMLIFADELGLASRLAARLREGGRPVTTVAVGGEFRTLGDGAYAIHPQSRGDYEALVTELRRRDLLPRTVLHCWSVSLAAGTDRAVPEETTRCRGFHSLVFLAQALAESRIPHPIDMVVVSNGLQEVAGEAVWGAERATVYGPCTVIPQEFPAIGCRSVDLEWSGDGTGLESAIAQLSGEIDDPPSEAPLVAYRGGHRWARVYEPVRLASPAQPAGLRPGGAYLITGGLGGLGLVLARDLSERVTAKLILVGRSGLPPRAEWREWLAAHDGADPVGHRIRAVQALEASGGEVMVIAADVADREQMQAALLSARARFGRIHGVIHAAGLPGGGLIQLKTREAADAILAPKVSGTAILEELLLEDPPDFLLLCSSITSILGGIGQVDYCGANAFLDAFARSCRLARRGTHVVAVNWDMWQEVGMAVTTAVPAAMQAQRQERLKGAIRPGEGLDVFQRVLASALSQVVVSTRDLALLQGATQGARPAAAAAGGDPGPAGPETPAATPRGRENLSTVYAAPRSELEQTVAGIWQRLLGIGRVGLHDDFFELGGHSLLAIQLMARLHEALGIEVPLRAVFEARTVAALAQQVGTLRWAVEGAAGAGGDREEIEL